MTTEKTIEATIQTDVGDIHLTLHHEKAPITVANFINLARRGFYDGLSFHRVIDDFMIQGGCPQGTGMGGPGYQFEDEFDASLRHDKPGVLSMANSGPNSNGSQFFITHIPTDWLDGKHTVFGEVKSSQDQQVVNQVRQGDGMVKVTIDGDVESFLEEMAAPISAWNDMIDGE